MSTADVGLREASVEAELLVELTGALYGADPWGVGGVRYEDVDLALRENRLRAANPCWADGFGVYATARQHAERVAWLVYHGWDTRDPLAVEVTLDEVHLSDGNHRLHALAFQSSRDLVVVEIYGFLDIAEELFGIPL